MRLSGDVVVSESKRGGGVKITTLTPQALRDQVIGMDSVLSTPFGKRLMVYCDYTASGQSLDFVEQYIQRLCGGYANTHTEDDATGRTTSRLLAEAEALIKQAVNAGPHGRFIACGTGATGAIDRLQHLLGVALAPASRARLAASVESAFGAGAGQRLREHLSQRQPVVLVGPYEHHSNEVSWRQGLATVVTVALDRDGGVDLEHLGSLLRDPAFAGRPLIGSFSAASNVTGMLTPVHEIAALLHRHGAHACFDFAASAPYVEINMNPEGEGWLDAVALSPHKFLGGPGASGVLVFNERLYRHDLPPTVGGGGTVDYVSPSDQDFIADIETREKAGTPGILQTLRAALAFEVKRAVGVETIAKREQEFLEQVFQHWTESEGIEILGNRDPRRRIGIVSFIVRDPRGGHLHPKFVTALLSDLFGIQSRAGCSCAGPYGHRLLGVDSARSDQYRAWVARGYHGIKPGWCRIGLHYVMDCTDVRFVIDAVRFIASDGYRFLPWYNFDPLTGAWTHRAARERGPRFSLDSALTARTRRARPLPESRRARLYGQFLQAARTLATQAAPSPAAGALEGDILGQFGDLRDFSAS
jgi:selenocysteine lyase/cysteine desulfurase